MSAADGILAYHVLEAAMDLFQGAPSKLSYTQRQEAENRARQALELESMVLSAPEAAGITIPDDRINESVNEIADRFEDEQQFLDDLALNDLNRLDLRKAITRKLWAEAVLDKISADGADVEDEAVRAAYEARVDKLQLPETRQVRHILVTINPNFAENTREEATKRIDTIKAELGSTPSLTAFEKAVARYSECPSVMEGGIVGKRVTPGKLYPEIDAILFGMQSGELAGPVETELGLHLVYCEIVRPAGPVPFEEIGPKLRDAIENAQRKKLKQAWLARLQEVAADPEAASKGTM